LILGGNAKALGRTEAIFNVGQRGLAILPYHARPATELQGYATKPYTATYRERGDGPPLDIDPGFGGRIDLSALHGRCPRHFRVNQLPAPREEDCFALRQTIRPERYGRGLGRFYDYHGLERPNLIGLSFGGNHRAWSSQLRYPHRLQVWLQGSGPDSSSTLVKLVAGRGAQRLRLPSENAFVNQFFGMLFGRRPTPAQLNFRCETFWRNRSERH